MSIYYLYVKIHRKTGLRYLGQTKQNPFKYPGSGTDWVTHLEKHGYDVDTEIILETTSKSERNRAGRYYSKIWKILTAVDDYGNKIWANRIIESGGGAGGKLGVKRKESTRKKLINANTGKNNPMYGTFWITDGKVNRKIRHESEIPDGWSRGRCFTKEHQLKFNKRCQKGSANSRYDPTIRHWINIDTGEEISAPKYDFCQMKNLHGKGIRAVLKGLKEHYRGWKLKN